MEELLQQNLSIGINLLIQINIVTLNFPAQCYCSAFHRWIAGIGFVDRELLEMLLQLFDLRINLFLWIDRLHTAWSFIILDSHLTPALTCRLPTTSANRCSTDSFERIKFSNGTVSIEFTNTWSLNNVYSAIWK
jgi:hypothetical protein